MTTKDQAGLLRAARTVLDNWNKVGAQADGYRILRVALEDFESRYQPATTQDQAGLLREAATILANDAAAVVINPRYFLESAEQQHELGVAVAKVRAALATPDEPVAGLDDGYWEKAYWNLVPKLLAIISDDRAIVAARLREDAP